MLIDRYTPEDVFARVPELAEQTDPVLRRLDGLLDDDPLVAHVKGDLGRRYPHTLDHGRHSTPVEVILRLLVIQHLYCAGWFPHPRAHAVERAWDTPRDTGSLRALITLPLEGGRGACEPADELTSQHRLHLRGSSRARRP